MPMIAASLMLFFCVEENKSKVSFVRAENLHSWPVITRSGDFHLGANQNILLGTPKYCTVVVGVRFLMWTWIKGFF